MVLKCQVKDHEDSSLQWSNPAQQTLYFGEKRGSVPSFLSLGRRVGTVGWGSAHRAGVRCAWGPEAEHREGTLGSSPGSRKISVLQL